MVVLIYSCYAKYIRKDEMVKLGGYGFLIVLTKSMEPTIQEKELIIIKEEKIYDLEEIVTYVDIYGNLVTHRIVQIDEYSFIAKGDGNEISDCNTNIKNIQGKVIFHSKILGIFIFYYLKFIIIIYFVVLLGVCFKNKLEKEISHENKEK